MLGLAKGAATDCRPFFPSPHKMAYLCRPLTSHIVVFSRLPRTPQVCHKQHRHLKSCQESLVCHLVGYSGGPTPINGTSALQVKMRIQLLLRTHSLLLGYRINGKSHHQFVLLICLPNVFFFKVMKLRRFCASRKRTMKRNEKKLI